MFPECKPEGFDDSGGIQRFYLKAENYNEDINKSV